MSILTELWNDVGLIRWPLVFSLGAVLFLGALSAVRLFRPGARADGHTKAWLDAVLFWGGFATASGVLGTLVGVIVAAQSIEAAGGGVPQSLLWGGVKVALLSAVFGLLILVLSALLWFVLQLRWRFLAADGDVDAGARA